MIDHRWIQLIGCVLVALAGTTYRAEAEFRVEHDQKAAEFTIFDGNQPVATYSYGDERVRRPYFANVHAPNGKKITRNWPPLEGIDPVDHDTIHPGIWMAFGDINGGDFWRNKALIRHRRFVQEPVVEADEVRFVVENEYWHDDQLVCVEEAGHQVLREDMGYLFLFDSTFLAVQRVDFGDQQEMGLGIRLATPLKVMDQTGRIVDSEGRVNEAQCWGRQADWCDYSGLLDGQRSGAVIMPDPRNFRPSRFHSRDYGFTAANPFGDAGFQQGPPRHTIVGPGKRLPLRFGVLIYSVNQAGPIDAGAVYADFVHTLNITAKPDGTPWQRHVIDDGSKGADGVRLADVNRDGLSDIVTGWEEGGETRVCFNPGPANARNPWPAVTVTRKPAPEDAFTVDIDGDGQPDVVTCCEGTERSVTVSFAPTDRASVVHASAWRSKTLSSVPRGQQWMYGLPVDVDGARGTDLVLGAKGSDAVLGWLQAPADPGQLDQWSWRPVSSVGWVMSLRSRDMDGDGDADLILSDRTGEASGCWWLENPAEKGSPTNSWKKHAIGGQGREVMFLDVADVDGDGQEDVVAAVRQDDLVLATRASGSPPAWVETSIPMPPGTGTGKAVAVGDLDADGRNDLVVTCENAFDVSGVFWMKRSDAGWVAHDISGREKGIKYDRIELLDLDADGDLDVLTCEERDNLGVIWYENPLR